MTSKYGGYMGKVLRVDLTSRTTSLYPWSDEERELYLGGKIMAAKILYDNLGPEVEPLAPENWLIVTTGPLTGSGAPCTSRFNISTVSPLTGLLASSNCGGDFGLFLKKAGYDGLIITGRAERPTWVEISDDRVDFHEADRLWGKTTGETQAELDELTGQSTGKIVIGPAGEHLVRYAAIFSGERAAGRAGVGAVMGSKNLKAVVACGTQTVPVSSREAARRIFRAWVDQLRAHPLTGRQLPRLGTAGLVAPMQLHRILATRNYQRGQFSGFEAVSGEALARKHLVKNKGCPTCPIRCGRVVEVDGRLVKGPELETLGLLGPNLENSDLELILRWNYLLDELGLDTISTGSTIAFAMELSERGMWDNGLRFGEVDSLARLFEDIAHRRGLGDLLAEGTRRLSERFGGQEFAINVKGLELAAYEPRGAVGMGLGYATANRGGCHLNGGYLVVLEGLGLNVDPRTTKSKPQLTVMFQNLMEAVSAGGSCLFTTYPLLPAGLITRPNSLLTRVANSALVRSGILVGLLNRLPGRWLPFDLPLLPHARALAAVTGMKMSFGRLKEIGERGFNLERLFNVRRGLTAADDSLPARLTGEPQDPADRRTVVPLAEMLPAYYACRGWEQDGRPGAAKLRQLGLDGGGRL